MVFLPIAEPVSSLWSASLSYSPENKLSVISQGGSSHSFALGCSGHLGCNCFLNWLPTSSPVLSSFPRLISRDIWSGQLPSLWWGCCFENQTGYVPSPVLAWNSALSGLLNQLLLSTCFLKSRWCCCFLLSFLHRCDHAFTTLNWSWVIYKPVILN